MKLAALKGELAFAALFAVVGLVWIVGSFELPFWAGFAPDSGFLPLVYGVLLLGLSVAVIVGLFTSPPNTAEREPLRKSFLILGTLVVGVASISFLGFAIPLFGMMLFMYGYVERLPIVKSVLASAVTTGVLVLIFEHWLKIPLPLSPWGF
jgi:Tripartite tricarboxylate transporter TctB family